MFVYLLPPVGAICADRGRTSLVHPSVRHLRPAYYCRDPKDRSHHYHDADNRDELQKHPERDRLRTKRIPTSNFILLFSVLEHLPGPARSVNEGCYLDRHIALGVAIADLQMIGPRRFDNRRIAAIRSEV